MDTDSIVAHLKADGFFISEAPLLPEFVAAADFSSKLQPPVKAVQNKPFFQRLEIDTDSKNPVTDLVKHPLLSQVSEGYLGVDSRNSCIDVYWSRFSGEGAKSSQRFHLDRDATPQIKLFIYCSLVAQDNGPLTLIGAKDSDKIKSLVTDPVKRVADEVVSSFKQIAFLGTLGSACFVDTSRCYHYGSRVKNGADPRIALVVQYVSDTLTRLSNY